MISIISYRFRLIFILIVAVSNAQAESYLTSYPGDFVLLHDHRIYYHCLGEGSHTVLIDTGIGDASANWIPIQQELSKHLKVCVYDRPGYGMSDPGPGPRTSSLIVEELYTMIKSAEINGPYIIVGHSFGGFTAQLFAKTYTDETAGIILVDSSHPQQADRLAKLDLFEVENRRIITGRSETIDGNTSELQKKWYMLNSRRKAVFAQMDELKYFQDSADEVSNAGPMPNIPIAVLTRGISQLPTLENSESMENVWLAMQIDLANSSQQGYQKIIPNSGHNIHIDAPDAVVDSVLEIFDSVKTNDSKEEV
jgi:pimeloyl-ACP methyl ester carboxylesterase